MSVWTEENYNKYCDFLCFLLQGKDLSLICLYLTFKTMEKENKNNKTLNLIDIWQMLLFVAKCLGVIEWEWKIVFLPYIIFYGSVLILYCYTEIMTWYKSRK